MNLSSEDKFSRTQDGIVLHDKNGFKGLHGEFVIDENIAYKALNFIFHKKRIDRN